MDNNFCLADVENMKFSDIKYHLNLIGIEIVFQRCLIGTRYIFTDVKTGEVHQTINRRYLNLDLNYLWSNYVFRNQREGFIPLLASRNK